jgi:Protein of unknown function (DUF1232)
MNLEAWKRRAQQLLAQTYAFYLAYRHPRIPWYAKVFAALVVGYVFSPIDPIPDFMLSGSKDYERLCASSEAFVYVAMVRLMVRRLARP